ncbi:MAG: Fe-S cluster assembly protein SufD [Acidobacteria bacterium]|nr:MAG: Fe-S cluster assembly protein SufD [Acidobacteriota bacterium]
MPEMVAVTDEKQPYLASFDRLERQRPRPSWIDPIRRSAIERFDELGFPTTRQEEWRRTSLAALTRIPFEPPDAGRGAPDAAPLPLGAVLDGADPGSRLVFINGRLARQLSSVRGLPAGAWLGSLAEAAEEHRGLVEPHLARHAPAAPFVALNTAFLDEGAFLFLPKDTILAEPVHLVFFSVSGARPTVTHPRTLVVAEAASQARIVETYAGDGVYFTNAVTEIVLGENAVLDHHKLQDENRSAFHIATVQARVERSGSFSSHSMSIGGALVRNDLNAVLEAEGADCSLDGLFLAGSGQHVDNHTAIDHVRPHGTSRELYKGILGAGGRGVFDGKIVVRKDAQKTDAMQVNRNLLLSDDALIDTKPQLEIYNNDVKCKHAATIGRLDDSSVFYLRSRGIDEKAARLLLLRAFASEVIGRVKLDRMRSRLEGAVTALLSEAERVGRAS